MFHEPEPILHLTLCVKLELALDIDTDTAEPVVVAPPKVNELALGIVFKEIEPLRLPLGTFPAILTEALNESDLVPFAPCFTLIEPVFKVLVEPLALKSYVKLLTDIFEPLMVSLAELELLLQ